MKKYIIVVCLLLLSSVIQGLSIVKTQSLLDKWRIEENAPAATLAIELPNQTPDIFVSGTTTLNGSQKINANTLFGIGSITKTFTAATILQLQDENKLNINDSLGKYFPEYPRWKDITIKKLLNMTSGITNYTSLIHYKALVKESPTAYHSPKYFIDLAYQQPDQFKPGENWYYSNTDYALLGVLVERITKNSLNDEFNRRFFKPLHLNNTYYSHDNYPSTIVHQRAHAYLDNLDTTNENPAYYGAGGSMIMSINDLIVWNKALFTPDKVLSENALNDFLTTVAVPYHYPRPKGVRYGLGIFSLDIPGYGLTWWYTGVINGYSSFMMWIPSKHIGIAAQVNHFDDQKYYILFPQEKLINTVLTILKNEKS